MNNAINWFEIPAQQFDRAVKFYNSILKTPLREETFGGMPHAVFSSDKEAVAGAVVKGDHLTPSSDGTCIYLNVEGYLDQALDSTAKSGGNVIMPKQSIGENGYIAMIVDTEGNRVGLHSMK